MSPDSPRWRSLLPARHVAAAVAAWAVVLLVVVGRWHPTPLYTAETDLIGEYIPAARELMAGQINLSHYAFKGPGYPLLLAAGARLFGGDAALAARYFSPIMAALAAWAGYLLACSVFGEAIGAFTALAMLLSPTVVRYAVEAGTDAPALAIMLFSTWLVISGGRPLSALVAGVLAACALLTRTNAAFLIPCSAVVLALGPRRLFAVPMYAIGTALPLVVWTLVASRIGPIPADQNYLNVAWELYGRGVPWDTFQLTIGKQFHSMREVLMYSPLRAFTHIAWNLLYYRIRDCNELVFPLLGVLAFPGVILAARNRGARAWSLHVIACAAVLAAVFYNPRFALYLLPFYLAAAGLSLVWCNKRLSAATERSRWRSLGTRAVPAIGVVALAASGILAMVSTVNVLASAPHEVRLAGQAMKSLGLSGGTIVARKPHVAYYAGMKSVAFPPDVPLWRFPAWARSAGAQYLFFSGIEQVMRPNFAVLADSALSLPGYRQILWQRLDSGRFYAVYQLGEEKPDSVAFASKYREALYAFDRSHPQLESRLYVAIELLDLSSPEEALAHLDGIVAAGAHDPAVQRYRTIALVRLGRWDDAERACRISMALGGATAWSWAQLGRIAMHQGKMEVAEKCLANAVELEPASVEYLEQLGLCRIARREFAAAAATFESCLRLSPSEIRLRREAMGAWQLAGNGDRVRQLFGEGVQAGLSPAALLNGPDGGR